MAPALKILAAVDLRAGAEEAVNNALAFAAALSADIEFLYVKNPTVPMSAQPGWPSSAFESAEGERSVSRRVLYGNDIAETIAIHAEASGSNLVWLAARRYGKWNRFWRASVADTLMALTDLPICIAGEDPKAKSFRLRKRRILCVLGLDGRDAAVVEHASEIADKSLSELVLLHVVPEANEALLHEAANRGGSPLNSEFAAAKLAAIARQLRTPATISAMLGEPSACISLAAREHAADLVVISRNGTQSKATYGDDVERLFGRLHCPLITVPAKAARAARQSDDLVPNRPVVSIRYAAQTVPTGSTPAEAPSMRIMPLRNRVGRR